MIVLKVLPENRVSGWMATVVCEVPRYYVCFVVGAHIQHCVEGSIFCARSCSEAGVMACSRAAYPARLEAIERWMVRQERIAADDAQRKRQRIAEAKEDRAAYAADREDE